MALNNPRNMASEALIPEQNAAYVEALAGSRAEFFGSCIGYAGEGHITLAAYPLPDPTDEKAINESVGLALKKAGSSTPPAVLTVISPLKPAPPDKPEHKAETLAEDQWWSLPLPPPDPKQKLRNILRRAQKEIVIETSPGISGFTREHEHLIRQYIRSRPLSAGTAYIFERLPHYLRSCPGAGLFSAVNRQGGQLEAMAVGDFSSFISCMYLFAFRRREAPPGTSDALLQALAKEGASRGHTLLNLGLGVNRGIEFFKKKWGAELFLPYIETRYTIMPHKSGLFTFLRNIW